MKLHLLVTHEETGSFEEVVTLPRTGGIIGRSRSDVLLDDPRCSRRHALIYWDSLGRLRIRDLESTNGTFVGEHRVRDAVLLPGQAFRIGRTKVLIQDVEGLPSPRSSRQVEEGLIERPEYDRR